MNNLHFAPRKNHSGNLQSNIYLPLVLVLAATIIIYIISIIDYPGFIADDYYIFAAVSKAPQNPVSLSIKEEFYLFARPVSYFNLWIQYHLFTTNPAPMKIYGLFFHLVSLVVFYFTIYYLCKVAEINFHSWIAALFTLLVSIHTDSYERIIWISNQTELFVNLFYWLSILTLILYIYNSKRIYIHLYLIFFCLSILSKQTSLHLPVLILFFTFIFNRQIGDKRKVIRKFSLVGLVLAAVYVFLNIFFYKSEVALTEVFWKKPFSAIGIFLHTFFPVYAQEVYNLFLGNKILAFLTSVVLLAALFYFILKRPHYRKPIIYIIVSAAIILFPRIVMPGGPRLNGIILCWGILLAVVIVLKMKSRSLLYAGLVLITLIFTASFYDKAINTAYIFKKYDKAVLDFLQRKGDTEPVIVTDEYGYFIQYKTYFIKNNRFGKDESYSVLPLGLSSILVPEKQRYKSVLLDAEMNGSVVVLQINNSLAYVNIDRSREIDPSIKFNEAVITSTGREGFSKLKVELPEYLANKSIWVFNGMEWKILNR